MISKRLLLLGGLAILIVVLDHTVGFGQIAMFLWTNRYRPVTVPNYDLVGSVQYYIFLAIRQLGSFAVPSFLFISGFFIGYAAQGERSTVKWRTIYSKIVALVIPYLIWSGIVYISDAMLGVVHPPVSYLTFLFTTGAIVNGPYYYIPLLCYLYILSPLIIQLAKTNWKIVLIITGLIQLCTLIVSYLSLFILDSPFLHFLQILTPDWVFLRWIFFFTIGIVFCFQMDPLKQWLEQNKQILLVLAIGLWVMNIVEAEVRFRLLRTDWFPNAGINTLTYNLFSIIFILAFLAFSKVSIPYSNILTQLSSKSYGIYLIHYLAIEFTAKSIYHFAPWILGQEWLFQPILILFGLGGPLLLMSITIRLQRVMPVRYYRYIFG